MEEGLRLRLRLRIEIKIKRRGRFRGTPQFVASGYGVVWHMRGRIPRWWGKLTDLPSASGPGLALVSVLILALTGCRTVVVQAPPSETQPVVRTSYADVLSNVTPTVVSVRTRHKLTEKEVELLNKEAAAKHSENVKERSLPKDLPHELEGLGSGVVISRNGYILTSAHVIEGADEIRVTTGSGEELKAKVIGMDHPTDIAVLKIDAANLPTIHLADSSKLRVGDIVLAVGNPLGVGQTVTSGIVSATRRGGLGLTDYEEFIQTDAPLNPGNSGGALIDARGRLVGISIAILTTGGGFEGIGLAVPVNLARNVMDQLMQHGRVVRGYLGVSLHALSTDLAKEFQLPPNKGALVLALAPNSPAARAGLETGDIVMAFDGRPVESTEDLRLNIARAAPGSRVKLKVRRAGGEKNLIAILAEMPKEQAKAEELEEQP